MGPVPAAEFLSSHVQPSGSLGSPTVQPEGGRVVGRDDHATIETRNS